jgi:hypothetical protein
MALIKFAPRLASFLVESRRNLACLFAIYGYALQLFFDFPGCTHTAHGAALPSPRARCAGGIWWPPSTIRSLAQKIIERSYYSGSAVTVSGSY